VPDLPEYHLEPESVSGARVRALPGASQVYGPILAPGRDSGNMLASYPCWADITFALPTYAQQKGLADPRTTKQILADSKAWDEATNNHDAAALAGLFTRDAAFVTDGEPIVGRQASQKWFTDLYQCGTPKITSASTTGEPQIEVLLSGLTRTGNRHLR